MNNSPFPDLLDKCKCNNPIVNIIDIGHAFIGLCRKCFSLLENAIIIYLVKKIKEKRADAISVSLNIDQIYSPDKSVCCTHLIKAKNKYEGMSDHHFFYHLDNGRSPMCFIVLNETYYCLCQICAAELINPILKDIVRLDTQVTTMVQ